MASDVLGIIEAAYALEPDPAAWLRSLAERTYAQLGAGLGLLAFEYRVDSDDHITIGEATTVEFPTEVVPMLRATLVSLPPWYVQRTFVRCECVTQSAASDDEIRAFNRPSQQAMAQAFGIHDMMMLGGMGPDRNGIYIGVHLPEQTTLADHVSEMWCRVAVHLVTALRLRRRLSLEDAKRPSTADAVITPEGGVEDARAEAREPEARDALRAAVLGLERARGTTRSMEPETAVAGWTGLVSARWTLLDHFESDGQRYVLARRNDVAMRGPAALSERERQVVSYAAMGHSSKLIAYELGLADSTVRVLLHRACRKLDVEGVPQLVEVWRKLMSSGDAGDETP